MSKVLRMLRCLRCGHEWWPRKPEPPVYCANPDCHSRYWNKPRAIRVQKDAAQVAEETRKAAGDLPIPGQEK